MMLDTFLMDLLWKANISRQRLQDLLYQIQKSIRPLGDVCSCHLIIAGKIFSNLMRKKKIMPLHFVILAFLTLKAVFLFIYTQLMACCSMSSNQVKPSVKAMVCGLLSSTKPFKITPILPEYSSYVHHITCFTSNQPRSLTSALTYLIPC